MTPEKENRLRALGLVPITEDVRALAATVRALRQCADFLEARGWTPESVSEIREHAAETEQQLNQLLRANAQHKTNGPRS